MYGYTNINFVQLLKMLPKFYSKITFITVFKKARLRPWKTVIYIYKPYFFKIHLHISIISLQFITVSVKL